MLKLLRTFLKGRIVFSALLSFAAHLSLNQTAVVFAEAPPAYSQETSQRLRNILADREYQPRDSSSSILQRILDALSKPLVRWFEALRDWFVAHAPPSRQGLALIRHLLTFLGALGHYLMKIVWFLYDTLTAFAFASGAMLILYLAWRYLRPVEAACRPETEVALPGESFARERISADPLVAFIAYRRDLRLQFKQRYNLSQALTDREIVPLLPSHDKDRHLWSEVCAWFERVAFKREHIPVADLSVLLEKLRSR